MQPLRVYYLTMITGRTWSRMKENVYFRKYIFEVVYICFSFFFWLAKLFFVVFPLDILDIKETRKSKRKEKHFMCLPKTKVKTKHKIITK